MFVKASLAIAFGVLQGELWALGIAFAGCNADVYAVANGALVPQFSAFKESLNQMSGLVPRQFQGTVCDQQCSVFENAVNTCTTTSCICSSSAEAGLQSCINCAVDAAPTASVISSAQKLINTYEQACPAASVTLPGSNTNPGSGTSLLNPTPITPITSSVIAPPVISTILPTQTALNTSNPSAPTTTAPTNGDPTGSNIIGGGGSGALSIHASASVGFLGVIVACAMFAL
ncbi:hypothetical protein BJ912DRAFT_1039898 [Pholiota molesta]|nr:hypothetical protein BJ912DRAFT_1039898 [Pholiota molesta]